MGDRSRGTHQLPHCLWPLILTPYHAYLSQKPLLLPNNCHPKSAFSTLSKILETVHSKTPNRHQNAPYFYGFCHWKTPIFCLACKCMSVWGECCSLKHGQKLENFVFLRQNRAIWWILLGANLIKVMKTKFQFYRLNRSNCYGRTSLEGRDDTQVTLVKHGRGYILQPSSVWFSDSAPPCSLNKCQVYLKLCDREQRHF